ncbi:MAG: ABC transporter ATP-binding protein [Acidobacteria bacterium]|nr:ABC transporter ATP-binding protein [Acidobacteriota bacterium]
MAAGTTMTAANAIEVRDVLKTYRRYGRRRQFGTLKSALLSGRLFRDLRPDDAFQALKGVSFDVVAGKTFGIVGRNGSGKSTMLKLIAGIGRPTAGSVTVRGRISALIELGAGFHPEISGRENVFINGMMMGLTKREVAKRFDEIVAFAELEDFIEAPVKAYSSGMYMRLGFAVAVHVDPEVLLVDEVLAVGDEAFTHKCLDKFSEFRRKGRTVLLVTHSLDLVTTFCDEVLWLDGGMVRAQGDPRRVIDAYRLDVAQAEDRALGQAATAAVASTSREPAGKAPPASDELPEPVPETAPGASDTAKPSADTTPPDLFKAVEGRWGSREVEIDDVTFVGASGQPSHVFPSGAAVEIRLQVHAHHPVSDLVFGVGIFNADGVCCYGTNTDIEGAHSGAMSGKGEARFAMDRLDLVAGTYKVDVAVHRKNGTPYDYHRLLYTLRITSPLKEAGICRLPHRWQFSGDIRINGLRPPEGDPPQDTDR